MELCSVCVCVWGGGGGRSPHEEIIYRQNVKKDRNH